MAGRVSVRQTAAPAGVRAVSLRLAAVQKWFEARPVLAGIDLDVEAGQFVVLLGPSGSGKTTLLRCVAGIERPDGGTIAIGADVVAGPGRHVPPERRNLSMVFQDYGLWPHMSVLDNVRFALRRTGLLKAAAEERTREVLASVGLEGFAAMYPSQLSGGEQQRVALARALVARPPLVLFDEPLSNLDANLRDRLRIQISRLTRDSGSTVVYITHDQHEALALADRIGIVHEGRLEQYGPPEAVYHHPLTPFVARFTGIAGELRGHGKGVAERGDYLRVQVGGAEVTATGIGVGPGQPVNLLIRTTALRLTDAAQPGGLPAVVEDVAFRGHGYEHAVRVASDAVLTGVFGTRRESRGARVGVLVDPAQCFAFAAATAEA